MEAHERQASKTDETGGKAGHESREDGKAGMQADETSQTDRQMPGSTGRQAGRQAGRQDIPDKRPTDRQR